jgi:hypothetical protein
MELPVPGYPVNEESVISWFRQRYKREPTTQETGAILDAMAQRDSTPPLSDSVEDPRGWTTDVSAPPADRR